MFRRSFLIYFLLVLIILSFSGCMGVLNKNNANDEKNQILAGDTTQQQPLTCIVYFNLNGQSYLVGQQHLISVPETKRVEEIILQELILGPKVGVTTLIPLINPNTRIISISDNNGLLFVTLSSHYLEPLSGTPQNWRDDDTWYHLVMQKRKLALFSIVNTLTQTGKYSKIQLFIDYDDSGQGQRPTLEEMGFIGDNSDQLLEPIGRNASIIFAPETSAMLFLNSFSEKNWEDASLYIAFDGENAEGNTISSEFSLLDLTLVDYTITSSTIAYDGQSAIVTINYFIRGKNGVEYTNSNVSLLMQRIDDIWKLSYVSINQLLNVSNG